ncbi:MAG: hypothetical protein RI897_2355 [Verrucomicrobiota bacterium]
MVEPEAIEFELEEGRVEGSVDPEDIIAGLEEVSHFLNHDGVEGEDLVAVGSETQALHGLVEGGGVFRGGLEDPDFGIGSLDGEAVEFLGGDGAALDPEDGAELVVEFDEVGAEGDVVVLEVGGDFESFAEKEEVTEESMEGMGGGFLVVLGEEELMGEFAPGVATFEAEAIARAHGVVGFGG